MKVHRSHSEKRRYVRTPKKTNLHFKKKKKGQQKCAVCGSILHGVSKKKHAAPSRKFGGYLCPKCLKQQLVESVRT